jgi:2-dehydro-3-deoxygluconokinase
MRDLVAIGECMIELSREGDGRFSLAYGGDTFNTAVYAARLGLDAGYVTALGDDPYSQAILALAARAGVATDGVVRRAGGLPGLYVIETDAKGERRFYYWREEAPARSLFEIDRGEAAAAAMVDSRTTYFSGITLSLYSDTGLERFAASLKVARAAGSLIAFDSNYRPHGWKGDPARARSVVGRFLRLVGLALPTFDDEQALWGDGDPVQTIERLKRLGVAEIVVKNGPAGVLIAAHDAVAEVPVPERVTPVDTTAAGDSFNAGYLAARLGGAAPSEAALLGHRLAGIVIRHRGAIVPEEATRNLRLTPSP